VGKSWNQAWVLL